MSTPEDQRPPQTTITISVYRAHTDGTRTDIAPRRSVIVPWMSAPSAIALPRCLCPRCRS